MVRDRNDLPPRNLLLWAEYEVAPALVDDAKEHASLVENSHYPKLLQLFSTRAIPPV
jgi:hypothetical protein